MLQVKFQIILVCLRGFKEALGYLDCLRIVYGRIWFRSFRGCPGVFSVLQGVSEALKGRLEEFLEKNKSVQ